MKTERWAVLLFLVLICGTVEGDGIPEGYVTVGELADAGAPWPDTLLPPDMQEARSFRLGVLPVAFPDRELGAGFGRAGLAELFFSRDTYRKSPEGEAAFGSMADFFRGLSFGRFVIEGEVFEPVEIETTAAEILSMPMVNTRGKYRELALEALRERDGADVLEGLQAICFLNAGDAGRRGRGLWPHRGKIDGVPYIQLPLTYEEGHRIRIGILCHEFGHFFGFKDKYGLRNSRQGPGPWCLIARGTHGGPPSRRAMPFPFCAWCRMQIGWQRPVTIDPRVSRKIALRPWTSGPGEAIRILVKEDGSEYFLLEVRSKRGAERDLPDEGLLIWHVGERRSVEAFPVREYDVILEAPHGRKVVDAATRYAEFSCWPKPGRRHFTPESVPSSRSRSAGALPVHLRNITRLPDGTVTFEVGPGDAPDLESPAAVIPRKRRLTSVLILPDGTEVPQGDSDRSVSREVDRLLYSEGTYYGRRRSVRGEDVRGSLRDYVEEVSGGRETVTGRRVGGVWNRVPAAPTIEVLEGMLPERGDGVVAFVAVPPGGRRYVAGELVDGTPLLVIRCGDGRYGELGPIARWWMESVHGAHEGPPAGQRCLLGEGHAGGGETGARQPFHPCAMCKLRLGWLDLLEGPPETLRPVEVFPEGWLSPDGTELVVRRGPHGFDEAYPEPGLSRWSLVEEGSYPDMAELERRLRELERSPAVTLSVAGKTLGDRPIWLVRVAGEGPLAPDERAALFVTAALHGNEANTVPAALEFLSWLVRYGAPEDRTVYVMPCVNADAYVDFLESPNTVWRPRWNMRPFDQDGDGKVDEDPYEDLNGDGQIGYMRRRTPDGKWEIIGREGIDNDEDGKYSEDIPGGVDLNRNFPEGWRPGRDKFRASRGATPLSEPETRAVADALLAHKNIRLAVDVHNDARTVFIRLGEPTDRDTDPRTLADYPSYGPAIEAAKRSLGYGFRRMARAGILASWVYEDLGVPGTILELGNGAKERAPPAGDAAIRNAWSQDAFGIDGWNDWRPFSHPQLGPVEIGGDWRTFVKRSPPPGKHLGRNSLRASAFLRGCLDALPRLVLEREGGKVLLRNTGPMPTSTVRLGEVDPGRSRTVLSVRPGTAVGASGEFTVLSRNAWETRLAVGAIAPAGSAAFELEEVGRDEAITVRVVKGPAGLAAPLTIPPRTRAGEVIDVPMAEHSSYYVLHVPKSYRSDSAAPLLVDLHGAAPVSRRPARLSVAPWEALCEEEGFLHLLPQSRTRGWGQREDTDDYILSCLEEVRAEYAVDPERIWLTGFSSGADYALGLVARHPDLFASAAPLNPGLFTYGRTLKKEDLLGTRQVPFFYVTGAEDVRRETVRQIVFTLKELGFDVAFRTVPDVGHAFPPRSEYEKILAFFEGRRPAGDPLEEFALAKVPVGDGHVVVDPAPEPPRGTLVVLPERGKAETRPELRALSPVREAARGLQLTVLLPWRDGGITAEFLGEVLRATGAPTPVLLFAHGGAGDEVPALLGEASSFGAALVTGPRTGFVRALEGASPAASLRVILGGKAFEREAVEKALAGAREQGAEISAEVIPDTRLHLPPSPETIRENLSKLLPE